jgi:hypothetical protein
MKNDGGSAFPQLEWEEGTGGVTRDGHGMSLRDAFALAALIGSSTDGGISDDEGIQEEVAEKCYQQADAMLAERERKK